MWSFKNDNIYRKTVEDSGCLGYNDVCERIENTVLRYGRNCDAFITDGGYMDSVVACTFPTTQRSFMRYPIMSNIITLYHGTIYDFDKIDVDKGKGNKDFGRGFYTSRDVSHAERLAVRNKHIEQERFRLRGMNKDVIPWLYVYEFDINNFSKLKVKEFQTADREWMRFIVLNRESRRKTQEHDYDIVIGPTANDNTRAAIQTVVPLTKGQVMTDKAIDALIMLIEPDNLPGQFFIGTQHAPTYST